MPDHFFEDGGIRGVRRFGRRVRDVGAGNFAIARCEVTNGSKSSARRSIPKPGRFGTEIVPSAFNGDVGLQHLLAAAPAVEHGRLFVRYRIGGEDPKLIAVVRTISRVLQAIDYLQV